MKLARFKQAQQLPISLNDKSMNLHLTNKRVLITGASRGIGAAIAQEFLDEGARVCIISRGSNQLYATEKKLQKLYNSKIFAEKCDCISPDSLEALRARIYKKWSGVDVVVANIGDGRSVLDPIPDEQQWNKVWSNNFDSALHTARTFLPMLKDSKGCLLFISSIAAIEAIGAPVDYSTAKSALLALAKNMSRKLGKDIRVNVIAPGNILFSGGSWDKKMKNNPKKVNSMISRNVPMNRFGTPKEVAAASVFLCSEKSSFITGAVLVVDGGQTQGVY